MLHMIAFNASSSPLSSLTNIAGVADPVLRVSGNIIYLSGLNQIAGAFAVSGATVTQAELQAPSLRQFANYDITPIDTGSAPTNPVSYYPHYTSPFPLAVDEGLQCLIKQTGNGNASVIVELSDGPIAPVSGPFITVQFTFTAPSGNYTWNNAAITIGQSLPVGNYNVVGARVEGASCIALRFVPVGAIYRPGILCVPTTVSADPDGQRFGGKGVMFSFNQLTPPTVDLFHAGASGTITGYLDLQKAS